MQILEPTDADGYIEQLAVPDLSVGMYRIPAGGVDPQSPHHEDEIYVVLSGRSTFVGDDTGSVEVGPGSVIFVPAGEGHRFVDITEDLAVVVVFGPAYGSRAPE
jgi:mannose-6-phosphate isomerase-like protein (cupin superfamily)